MDAWILDNADIEQSPSLEVYVQEGLHTFAMSVEGSTLIITDKNHLKYIMKNLPLQATWVHPSHVLNYDGHALSLRRTPTGIVAEIYCHDNEAYEKVCARHLSGEEGFGGPRRHDLVLAA